MKEIEKHLNINKKAFDRNDTNVVKGIAILLLLFHHLFLVYDRLINNGVAISKELFDNLYFDIVSARICVWVFVFLSAYGLSKKYEETDKGIKSLRQFYFSSWGSLMKKWLIAYFLMVLIYKLKGGNLWQYYNFSKKNIVLDIVEWNDFFGVGRFFGSWYLCFAQLLILFVPVFFNIVKKYGIYSILLIYIIMQFIPNGIISTGGGDYLMYVPTAMAGVVFSSKGYLDKWVTWKRQKNKQSIKLIASVSLFILAWVMLEAKYHSNIGKNIVSIYSMIASIAICCVVCQARLLRLPLSFLGRHSAEMFMSNVFFYIELPQIIYFWKNPVICYIALVVVSVLFSMISKLVMKGIDMGWQHIKPLLGTHNVNGKEN